MLEKGIPFEWTPDAGEQLPALNPLGKIPVLITGDGLSVYDSRVIVEYLETVKPDPVLLPGIGMKRVNVKLWEALADGISDAVVAISAETRRAQALQSSDWIARQQLKIERGLSVASQKLGARPWCEGDALTVGDLALVAALGFVEFKLPTIPWRQRYPNLATFHAAMHLRPSISSTVPAA